MLTTCQKKWGSKRYWKYDLKLSDIEERNVQNHIWNLVTWEHLPYIAVLKGVHRTATVCSSILTFFRGSKLLTVAVLLTLAKTTNRGRTLFGVHAHSVHTTANLGSFMDTFKTFCLTLRILHETKLQTVAVLWTLFGVVTRGRKNIFWLAAKDFRMKLYSPSVYHTKSFGCERDVLLACLCMERIWV